jgi:hypothetical protein
VSKKIVCGFEIEARPRRISSDAPTTIYLHKLGSSESSWMTPTELRAFISALSTELLRAETEER